METAVMPGFMPGIHVFLAYDIGKTWMTGTSPAMTNVAIFATCRYEK
jgi:hypothetical protein